MSLKTATKICFPTGITEHLQLRANAIESRRNMSLKTANQIRFPEGTAEHLQLRANAMKETTSEYIRRCFRRIERSPVVLSAKHENTTMPERINIPIDLATERSPDEIRAIVLSGLDHAKRMALARQSAPLEIDPNELEIYNAALAAGTIEVF